MQVLLVAADPAVADSAVLAAAGLDLSAPLLMRHHLLLPVVAIDEAAALLGQDGYSLVVDGTKGIVQVRASRTQLLTAMSASQERSRMAGLAQRLGGDVAGWDACGPAAAAGSVGSPA
jgi:phosphoenolpyruvate-protein kinase (PTS system EI component)